MKPVSIFVLLCCLPLCAKATATQFTKFEDAVKAAQQVEKTREGQIYYRRVDRLINKYFFRGMIDCNEGKSKVDADVWIVFVVSSDGHTRTILSPPGQPFVACAARVMQMPLLPRPPKDSWPVLIHGHYHKVHDPRKAQQSLTH